MTVDDAGSQFDRDFKIREGLIKDLGVDGRSEFDAILITGDVAYHGQQPEFVRAKQWIEELRVKTGCNPESIFVIPGNHDVDQKIAYKSSALWDLHQGLRGLSGEQRLASLQAKLQDNSLDFLAALKDYRAFSQEFGCPTSSKALAWVHIFEKHFEDGSKLRLHGLNSALVSDGSDAKSNLYLSEFQFNHFDSEPDFINVVLCHHPQNWLMDDNESNDHFRTQAQLVLSGHEHDTRCYLEGGSLRLRAGAIHPNPRESRWEPCYHVVQLSVPSDTSRKLHVRVETRTWRPKDNKFSKYLHDGLDFYEVEVPLPAWKRNPARTNSAMGNTLPPEPGPESEKGPQAERVGSSPSSATMHDTFAAARRSLIVHFFRLGTLSRLHAAVDAKVWDDGDDALEGQERWARVFERAERTKHLHSLWTAVAARDSLLSGQPNPFNDNE